MRSTLPILSVFSGLLVLAACGGSDGSSLTNGGGGTGAAGGSSQGGSGGSGGDGGSAQGASGGDGGSAQGGSGGDGGAGAAPAGGATGNVDGGVVVPDGGAADAAPADPCEVLAECCVSQTFLQGACDTLVASDDPANCSFGINAFCDGDPGGGADGATGGCTELAACCPSLFPPPTQAECNTIASAGDEEQCEAAYQSSCN
jgi:hypothetical protein